MRIFDWDEDPRGDDFWPAGRDPGGEELTSEFIAYEKPTLYGPVEAWLQKNLDDRERIEREYQKKLRESRDLWFKLEKENPIRPTETRETYIDRISRLWIAEIHK